MACCTVSRAKAMSFETSRGNHSPVEYSAEICRQHASSSVVSPTQYVFEVSGETPRMSTVLAAVPLKPDLEEGFDVELQFRRNLDCDLLDFFAGTNTRSGP